MESEVVGARRQLAECGVPEQDIVGFRAPYLFVDPQLREVLHENGFLYDRCAPAADSLQQPRLATCGWCQLLPFACVTGRRHRPPLLPSTLSLCSSIMESMNGSVSDGFSSRLWPFDMGAGVPIACASDDTYTQLCSTAESWPGLWEVPGQGPSPPAQGHAASLQRLLGGDRAAAHASGLPAAPRIPGCAEGLYAWPLLAATGAVWKLSELGGPYPMDPGFSYPSMSQ